MRYTFATTFALVAVPALALADPLKEVVSPLLPLEAPPSEWMGLTPHLVMVGEIDGYKFDIQLVDVASAANISTFAAKREYVPDAGAYRYVDFEVTLEAVIEGIERQIELEFENNNFLDFDTEMTFELGSENFPKGKKAYFELEFEWEAQGTSVNEEIGDWTGTFILHLDEGETDDKGLSGAGRIGAFVYATRDSDTLIMSFTAPVNDYEVGS